MAELKLPKLRQDLQLKQMEHDEDGFPTWVIYDDASHRYFKIGWLEFEILARWHLDNPKNIVESINKETTLNITEKNVLLVAGFLQSNELVIIENQPMFDALLNKKMKRKSYIKQLLDSYLFFIIPLANPDRFLDKTIGYVKILFTKTALSIFCVIALLGVYLIIRHWDEYINTFNYLFNLSNVIIFVIAISMVKIIHELSHAYVAKYLGCRVASIGIAFIVMWPVLYTDTTDAWKLTKKSHRVAIAAAGVGAEMVLTFVAFFLWPFVPVGLPQYFLFFISTVSIFHSLLINMNPLLRFDGYYLFADLVGVSNLRSTSFVIGSWKLREWLFKFGEKAPIAYPKKKEKLLIFYAYFSWIYRFLLITAIALLVYHYFFKVLGIILMLIEVWFFILYPFLLELKDYWVRRKVVTVNKNSIITFSTVALLLIIFFVPWSGKISAPATLEYAEQTKIYTQFSGEIRQVNFISGEQVNKGQLLISFKNYNLDYSINAARIDIAMIKTRMQTEIDRAAELGYKSVSIQDLQSKENELQGLLAQKSKLEINAPFSGVIFSNNQGFHQGVWLGQNTLIGDLVNPIEPVIYAYIPEKDLHRIRIGESAIFYPNQVNVDKVSLKIVAIDSAALEDLESPYLASIYGGKIAVIQNKEAQLEIQESLYRVKLVPTEKMPVLFHVATGEVQIRGTRESYASQIWKLISATLIKESGF